MCAFKHILLEFLPNMDDCCISKTLSRLAKKFMLREMEIVHWAAQNTVIELQKKVSLNYNI